MSKKKRKQSPTMDQVLADWERDLLEKDDLQDRCTHKRVRPYFRSLKICLACDKIVLDK